MAPKDSRRVGKWLETSSISWCGRPFWRTEHTPGSLTGDEGTDEEVVVDDSMAQNKDKELNLLKTRFNKTKNE